MGLYADNEICTICLADNGFIVKLKDVAGEAERQKNNAKKGSTYQPSPDPEIIVAATTGDLMKLLKKKLPEIVSATEQYDEAFGEAADAAPSTKY